MEIAKKMITRKIILLSILIPVVALSGCEAFATSADRYVKDIITVEDYSVWRSDPYAGRLVTMSFVVRNNADFDMLDMRSVPRVTVNFFDLSGFSLHTLKCGYDDPKTDEHICEFTDITPGDDRSVSLKLRAPSSDVIKTKTTFIVSYYVNYTYSGFRQANIPIIDGTTIKRSSEFIESAHTNGPIQLSFKPPVGGTRIDNNEEIEEHWGVQGEPFQVEMNLDHVGSSSVGDVGTVSIEKGKVTLRLANLERDQNLPCDFEVVDGSLQSIKKLELPGTLACHFILTDPDPPPKTTGTIEAEFDYTYKFIRHQTFEVRANLD